MRWTSDACKGIPGGENREAEVRAVFGMVESPFPMWEHKARGGGRMEKRR